MEPVVGGDDDDDEAQSAASEASDPASGDPDGSGQDDQEDLEEEVLWPDWALEVDGPIEVLFFLISVSAHDRNQMFVEFFSSGWSLSQLKFSSKWLKENSSTRALFFQGS